MRRSTLVALLLVAAATSSQCSDGDTTAIGPSGGVAASTGRFANAGGSAQGEDKGTSGGGESGPGSESSISRLALIMVTDRNSDGRPNRGDSITFTISTTQMWDQVSVVCTQNGTEVLRAVKTADAFTPLALGSPTWQAGAADCKATLEQLHDTNVTPLASATFTAGA